jgi:two-component system, LuxR family, response regulator FixJ
VKESIPTVTVIDDDDAVRSSLKLLLKSVNLPVVVYASAQEFLPRYILDQPGCLVVDVRMPGMSGLELQQQLNLKGATIPVIFITGHGDISMAVEAMQHGAFDFLQKPFRDQDLLDRVQRALEKDAANRRELAQADRIREHLKSLRARRTRSSRRTLESVSAPSRFTARASWKRCTQAHWRSSCE